MYYTTQITKMKDGSPTAIGTFEYETRDVAVIAYHNILASSMSNDNVASVLAIVINEHGGTEMREYWQAPTVEE